MMRAIVLDRVGLADVEKKRSEELSEGMQQKVPQAEQIREHIVMIYEGEKVLDDNLEARPT